MKKQSPISLWRENREVFSVPRWGNSERPVSLMSDAGFDYGNSRVDPTTEFGPVVLACDEGYVMPLATTLRSIVDANPGAWPLDFHVLYDRFSGAMQERVMASLPKGSASIRWILVDLSVFREFATLDYISKMTYARFLIPRVFADSVTRILYLDADILVLDDLCELWKADLDGAVLGAVVDGLDPKLKSGKPGFEELPRVRDYFNAGVLLIDLPTWRKERVSERALEYLSLHPRSPYADQDALNAACDGRWQRLDPRWNFQDHYQTRIAELDPRQRPGIVHFVTSSKPWKPTSLSLNASFYDGFRARTAFARNRRQVISELAQRLWCRSTLRARRCLTYLLPRRGQGAFDRTYGEARRR